MAKNRNISFKNNVLGCKTIRTSTKNKAFLTREKIEKLGDLEDIEISERRLADLNCKTISLQEFKSRL